MFLRVTSISIIGLFMRMMVLASRNTLNNTYVHIYIHINNSHSYIHNISNACSHKRANMHAYIHTHNGVVHKLSLCTFSISGLSSSSSFSNFNNRVRLARYIRLYYKQVTISLFHNHTYINACSYKPTHQIYLQKKKIHYIIYYFSVCVLASVPANFFGIGRRRFELSLALRVQQFLIRR